MIATLCLGLSPSVFQKFDFAMELVKKLLWQNTLFGNINSLDNIWMLI
jgi:hypothetical protein